MDEMVYRELREGSYPVFIWGIGALSIEVTKRLEENGVPIAGYFVDEQAGQVETKYGVKLGEGDLWTLEELEEKHQEIDVVVGHGHYEKRDLMQEKTFVHRVYLIGEPYPQYRIDPSARCLARSQEEMGEVLGYLADESSRNALESYVRFKATNDPEYLLQGDFCIDGMFGMQMFSFGQDECYLDVGAWEGDTMESFLEKTKGNYQYLCGVEPEAENFQILKEKCSRWRDAEVFQIGLGSQEGSALIRNENKQSAYLSDDVFDGEEVVAVKKLDDFMAEKRFTTIKISVAFGFLDILLGGSCRLRRDRPKLIVNVAADHRLTVFETIRWIHDLDLGYKIALRFDMPMTTRLYLYAY